MSDGMRCRTECLMEGGDSLKIGWKYVLDRRSDGRRCRTEGLIEGGNGLKIGLKEVAV